MNAVSCGQFHRYHTGGGQTNHSQVPPERSSNKKPRRSTLPHRDFFDAVTLSATLTLVAAYATTTHGNTLTVTVLRVFTGIGAGAIATLTNWLLVADELPPR